jgi:hypothetical protein
MISRRASEVGSLSHLICAMRQTTAAAGAPPIAAELHGVWSVGQVHVAGSDRHMIFTCRGDSP